MGGSEQGLYGRPGKRMVAVGDEHGSVWGSAGEICTRRVCSKQRPTSRALCLNPLASTPEGRLRIWSGVWSGADQTDGNEAQIRGPIDNPEEVGTSSGTRGSVLPARSCPPASCSTTPSQHPATTPLHATPLHATPLHATPLHATRQASPPASLLHATRQVIIQKRTLNPPVQTSKAQRPVGPQRSTVQANPTQTRSTLIQGSHSLPRPEAP